MATLKMVQHSMLNGFKYDFLRANGALIGGFEFAFFAQAKNARIKLYENGSKGAIQVSVCGEQYLVHHFYTRRGFTNDVLYSLENKHGDELATAEVLVATKEQRLPRVLMRSPFSAELGVSKSFFKRSYTLLEEHTLREIGVVAEPSVIQLKRELTVTLEQPNDVLAAFLAIVTLCARY